MNIIKQKLSSTKRGLKEIHTKKPQIEFFTALLTIPVLLTVIILNINNLKGNSNNKAEADKPQTIVITQPSGSGSSNNSTNTNNIDENNKEKEVVVTKEACEPGIGEVSITTPEENAEVSDNPVNVDIEYDENGYCAVVWSYRVNGGAWSSYDDTSISLFNLTPGNVKLDLRVKSVVNSDTKSLSRNFKYTGNITNSPSSTITPTPTP